MSYDGPTLAVAGLPPIRVTRRQVEGSPSRQPRPLTSIRRSPGRTTGRGGVSDISGDGSVGRMSTMGATVGADDVQRVIKSGQDRQNMKVVAALFLVMVVGGFPAFYVVGKHWETACNDAPIKLHLAINGGVAVLIPFSYMVAFLNRRRVYVNFATYTCVGLIALFGIVWNLLGAYWYSWSNRCDWNLGQVRGFVFAYLVATSFFEILFCALLYCYGYWLNYFSAIEQGPTIEEIEITTLSRTRIPDPESGYHGSVDGSVAMMRSGLPTGPELPTLDWVAGPEQTGSVHHFGSSSDSGGVRGGGRGYPASDGSSCDDGGRVVFADLNPPSGSDHSSDREGGRRGSRGRHGPAGRRMVDGGGRAWRSGDTSAARTPARGAGAYPSASSDSAAGRGVTSDDRRGGNRSGNGTSGESGSDEGPVYVY